MTYLLFNFNNKFLDEADCSRYPDMEINVHVEILTAYQLELYIESRCSRLYKGFIMMKPYIGIGCTLKKFCLPSDFPSVFICVCLMNTSYVKPQEFDLLTIRRGWVRSHCIIDHGLEFCDCETFFSDPRDWSVHLFNGKSSDVGSLVRVFYPPSSPSVRHGIIFGITVDSVSVSWCPCPRCHCWHM
jgi:hypothetical protein